MNISLTAIAAAVGSAFTVAEDLVTDFNALKPFISQMMEVAETTFTQSTTAGETKLQAVLATAKAIATAIGVSWSTGLEAAITAFINTVKAAFNAFSGIVAPSASTSAVAPAA